MMIETQKSLRRYYLFLGLELLVVLGISAIFRFIPDRVVAGLVAGALFFFSTSVILVVEWLAVRRWTWALIGGLLFFFASVLPVLIWRALSWGQPFETAQVWGITGGFLHRSSNLFFLIFLIGIFLSIQKTRREALRAQGNDKRPDRAF